MLSSRLMDFCGLIMVAGLIAFGCSLTFSSAVCKPKSAWLGNVLFVLALVSLTFAIVLLWFHFPSRLQLDWEGVKSLRRD